jgi:hypothetical protein
MEVRTLVTSPEPSVVENLDGDHRRISYFTEYEEMKNKLKEIGRKNFQNTYTSNFSFHAGLSVLLAIAVVLVCSPSTVSTANGSGRLSNSRFTRPLELYTLKIVRARRKDDCSQLTVNFDKALWII